MVFPRWPSAREETSERMEWGFENSNTNTAIFRAGDTVVEAPVWLGAQRQRCRWWCPKPESRPSTARAGVATRVKVAF